MVFWDQWVRQPQRVRLRRVAFQVHLWTGLAIGLYIVVLSLTGSVLVYRRELDAALRTPRPVYDETAERLSADELRAAAERAYPGHAVTAVSERITRRNPAATISLERAGIITDRLFDPYTGADLGDAFTAGERGLLWVVRLHDELLFGAEGRFWNGVGSALVTLLCLTGAVVWWPGVARWRRSLAVHRRAGWRRFTWDLHSALGFWFFLFVLMWGVSGFYMGVPEPFTMVAELVSDPNATEEQPADIVLAWLARVHFGRWSSGWLKALWAIAGIVPALLFVTGAVMWWNRVLRRKAIRDVGEAGGV